MSTSERAARGVVLAALAWTLGGCVTVKPQERTVLADPLMQVGNETHAGAQTTHALENREAAAGGDGVSGGGCGCN